MARISVDGVIALIPRKIAVVVVSSGTGTSLLVDGLQYGCVNRLGDGMALH